jgi:hypothetical protein
LKINGILEKNNFIFDIKNIILENNLFSDFLTSPIDSYKNISINGNNFSTNYYDKRKRKSKFYFY